MKQSLSVPDCELHSESPFHFSQCIEEEQTASSTKRLLYISSYLGGTGSLGHSVSAFGL